MTKLIIDGKEIEVPEDYTLLQACEAAGAEVPRFCFHERLSIAGNCRMCLVEVKGGPEAGRDLRLGVRDCRPGPNGEPPEIFTSTPMVKKAREGVMEFLLINHPLDCPICDQGGECDLQDQAMAYGVDTSRYHENKRAVEDKYIGPLVKTSMNRCIHCTRCVRFTTEVAGVPEIGAIGRGEDMEITTYLEQAMTSELQGNVIDLCPVGALTSKPYAFTARPWELTKTESIDVMDARRLGNPRRHARPRGDAHPAAHQRGGERGVDLRQDPLMWDGLRTQRLDRPYVRENGQLRAGSLAGGLCGDRGEGRAHRRQADRRDRRRSRRGRGDVRAEGLLAKLGSRTSTAGRTAPRSASRRLGRASYIFNPTIAGIERADAILIIGANPRFEASVLNARIRKRWRSGQLPVGVIGAKADLTYDYDYLGAGPETLAELASGKHSFRAC